MRTIISALALVLVSTVAFAKPAPKAAPQPEKLTESEQTAITAVLSLIQQRDEQIASIKQEKAALEAKRERIKGEIFQAHKIGKDDQVNIATGEISRGEAKGAGGSAPKAPAGK